jgi:hypothetical protein
MHAFYWEEIHQTGRESIRQHVAVDAKNKFTAFGGRETGEPLKHVKLILPSNYMCQV